MLSGLQDSVQPFSSDVAVSQIESELGGPLGQFFSEISSEPVAAASLAQVYKAKLASTGEYVAVKVQRPAVLEVVSKDLYVLRRAAEIVQGLVERFAPQQRTNYTDIFNEWAVGFYTELDFVNEAANQKTARKHLEDSGVKGVLIPKVYHDLTTRRVLVTEWVDGSKLSTRPKDEIRELTEIAQEAFLTQLLQVGFFHADPHPGNIMRLDDQSGEYKLALIDWGLVAKVTQEDQDTMVSAIIHLANKDYASLVNDFVDLKVLPPDCDKQKVIPLMDKALSPYVRGGGAQRYQEEVKKSYGMEDGSFNSARKGFSAMTQDAITVLNDVPFSIPPYFALLGRALVTLEGIALTGNEDYGLIMEAYPFVARKLLSDDRPEIQKALLDVLYSGEGLRTSRVSAILNSAMGYVAKSGAFVDLDALPDEEASLTETLRFALGPDAESIRGLLLGQAARKAQTGVFNLPLLGPLFSGTASLSVP